MFQTTSNPDEVRTRTPRTLPKREEKDRTPITIPATPDRIPVKTIPRPHRAPLAKTFSR